MTQEQRHVWVRDWPEQLPAPDWPGGHPLLRAALKALKRQACSAEAFKLLVNVMDAERARTLPSNSAGTQCELALHRTDYLLNLDRARWPVVARAVRDCATGLGRSIVLVSRTVLASADKLLEKVHEAGGAGAAASTLDELRALGVAGPDSPSQVVLTTPSVLASAEGQYGPIGPAPFEVGARRIWVHSFLYCPAIVQRWAEACPGAEVLFQPPPNAERAATEVIARDVDQRLNGITGPRLACVFPGEEAVVRLPFTARDAMSGPMPMIGSGAELCEVLLQGGTLPDDVPAAFADLFQCVLENRQSGLALDPGRLGRAVAAAMEAEQEAEEPAPEFELS